ncbi:aggregation-promoting factor [Streptococcus marmotae]|uniref:aggregation-promoting factor n=1 Tax=Streptococcus marmotae TaxID=1825069 RepID=UPI0008375445|nr:LysM peptidoglycan-binding domain-containing protein [Streptococcus marmotae]
MTLTTKQFQLMIAGVIAMGLLLITNAVNADTYKVKAGDTLSEIAVTHRTTVESLVTLNKITNPNLIYVDQELELGNGKANGQTTTTVKLPPAVRAVPASPAPTPAPVIQEVSAEEVPVVVEAPVSYTSTVAGDEAAAKEWIAQKESGGSYTAQNGIYYGRYQLTDSYLNGDYSAENQERVADAYVTNRYGSWSAAQEFWLANGWY